MSKPEHILQQAIRLELPKHGATCFRVNVGQAWAADSAIHVANGDMILKSARPFNTGVPQGFADLFGITDSGRFFAIEVKSPTGRVSSQQKQFIEHIRAKGGLAGVARSVDDAVKIIRPEA